MYGLFDWMETMKICAADCTESADFTLEDSLLGADEFQLSKQPSRQPFSFSFFYFACFCCGIMSKYDVVAFGYGILYHSVLYSFTLDTGSWMRIRSCIALALGSPPATRLLSLV